MSCTRTPPRRVSGTPRDRMFRTTLSDRADGPWQPGSIRYGNVIGIASFDTTNA
jgi:hypothetical protein